MIKLLVVFIGGALLGYVLICIPVLLLLAYLNIHLSPIISFLFGFLVGGLTPPILLSNSRIFNWTLK